MRGRVLDLVVVCGLLALGGAEALAQEGGIETKIPFEFTANGTVLPAGDYIVDLASTDEPFVLTIRSRDARAHAFFDTNEMPARDDPGIVELVFDEFGDKLYLSEVWGVEDTGREVRNTAKGMPQAPPGHTHRRLSALRIPHPAPTGKTGK
jgi:hypothetical protein